MNADSILERYGLELLPRPTRLSPSEAALADPDRTFCFLDTNLLVHAKFLNEVKWAELCGTKRATVVIAVTVLDEFQKIDYNQRASKRARNRSAQVTNLLIDFGADAFRLPGAHLRDTIGLTILKDTPRPSTDEGFDPNHQDDRLHVEVLQMMDKASRVLPITHDRPMFLRAQSRGIPVQLAPNEIMLLSEPDPKDREIEALRAELKELREKVDGLDSENSQIDLDSDLWALNAT